MLCRYFRFVVQASMISAFSLGSICAQTCSAPPVAPSLNPDEKTADDAFADALLKTGGCSIATDQGCGAAATALQNLTGEALSAADNSHKCATTGTKAGGAALTVVEKQWYQVRSAFWLQLYGSLQQQSDAVSKGTFKLSDDVRTSFLGIPPQPKAPALATTKLATGTSSLTIKVDVADFSGTAPSSVYVCLWPTKPKAANAMDCTDPMSPQKPASLSGNGINTDGANNSYFEATTNGSYTFNLKTPLQSPQYVSLVQSAVIGGTPHKLLSADASSVGLASQCNHDISVTPYSDCDMKFSIIGGVEQSAQSSLPSSTDPFLRIFTRAPDGSRVLAWGSIRLLGAPQASSTSGVVSTVTDPAGNITTQTFSGIGNSVDFMIGGEYMITTPGARMYSLSLIAGYGGTTPLAANSLSQAFKAPPFGTVECGTLQSRFAAQFKADNITPGTTTNAGTTPACLVNGNSMTSASGVSPVTFTSITTIGFSNQDRSNFLGKALFGIRTIDRFTGSGTSYCGDPDATKQIGPCSRGVVDFVFGQDASVTGGKMRHWVFKVDAVHPLPVKSVSFLYLFGSATFRFTRNTNLAPLVLQSGDVTSLTGNGTNAVPNTSVVILPFVQPDRDFYRFGAGVDINSVFKKLFSSPTPPTQ